MKKCPYCKEEIQDDAVKCRYCGSNLNTTPPPISSNPLETDYFNRDNAFDSDPVYGKSRGICGLLAILIGCFGVQYFYLNKIAGGFITILLTVITCGLWSTVSLIQGILMLCMNNRSFYQKYVASTSTFPLF